MDFSSLAVPRYYVPRAHRTTLSCHCHSLQPVLSSRHHTKVAFSHWCFKFLFSDFVNKLGLQPMRKVASTPYLGFWGQKLKDPSGSLFIFLFLLWGSKEKFCVKSLKRREDYCELSLVKLVFWLRSGPEFPVFLSSVLPETLSYALFFPYLACKSSGSMCSLSIVLKIDWEYLGVNNKELYNTLSLLTLRNLLKTDVKWNCSTDTPGRRKVLSCVSDRVSPGGLWPDWALRKRG